MKKFFCLFMLILSIPYFLSGYFLFQVYLHPQKYKDEILYYSNKYSLNASLVASIINVESSYNANAKSTKDAIGLMQIKLQTANFLDDLSYRKRITENELFIANKNIKYGCEYLNYLMNKFEELDTVTCAYNAGETKVRNWLKNNEYSTDKKKLIKIPYKETKNYLKKVNENIKYYKRIYN